MLEVFIANNQNSLILLRAASQNSHSHRILYNAFSSPVSNHHKQVPRLFPLTTNELCLLLSGYPVIKNDLEQEACPPCRWYEGMDYREGKTCSSQCHTFPAKFPASANQGLKSLIWKKSYRKNPGHEWTLFMDISEY